MKLFITVLIYSCCFALEILGTGNVPWKNQQITYTILNYSPYLTEGDTRRAIRQAFDIWSAVIPRDFMEVSAYDLTADIKIKFASLNHGEGHKFDGKGGALAHAGLGGSELHFDSDEKWKKYRNFEVVSYEDADILWTATHEIGHILGLNHSRDENSLMYFSYNHEAAADSNGRYIEPKLLQSDINRIQAIYGSRRQIKPPKFPQIPQHPPLPERPQMPKYTPKPEYHPPMPEYPRMPEHPQMEEYPPMPPMPEHSPMAEYPQIASSIYFFPALICISLFFILLIIVFFFFTIRLIYFKHQPTYMNL